MLVMGGETRHDLYLLVQNASSKFSADKSSDSCLLNRHMMRLGGKRKARGSGQPAKSHSMV